MPPRQARPARRRVAPSAPLPRPSTPEAPDAARAARETARPASPLPARGATAPRRPLGVRAHHVTEDYRYVRTDLLLVAAVSAVAMAFVVGMSFAF